MTRASSGGIAERDGVSHHRVDVTVVRDVLRFAVVGAERDPRRAVFERERRQRAEVARRRRLADEEPEAGTQPLAALFDRRRLVVRADPGRRIRVQRLPEDAGRVTVDMTP